MFAINYIETRYIGDFRNEMCPILYIQENFAVKQHLKHIWRLVDIKRFSSNTCLFTFSSPHFRIRQQIKGVQWFGRYFYIKPFAAGIDLKERPYSVVLCLTQENIRRRKMMFDYFKGRMEGRNVDMQKEEQVISSTISFVIKLHFGSENLSRFIHKT